MMISLLGRRVEGCGSSLMAWEILSDYYGGDLLRSLDRIEGWLMMLPLPAMAAEIEVPGALSLSLSGF